ncbi:MAG: hypothetical protein WC822_05115 [Candidatus Paceibacterota bacterium]
MGTIIETNDTLQITREQGFPPELDLEVHLKNPIKADIFTDKIFEFKNKPKIRIYHQPPVRNFLVENKNGKWVYWGLVHVLEITHDYKNKTTSGKYKIIYINTPEEMKLSHNIIDRNPETDFFSR